MWKGRMIFLLYYVFYVPYVVKKYWLEKLRTLIASTSGRQVCNGKNTSTRFGGSVFFQLTSFRPKPGISPIFLTIGCTHG